MFNKKDLLQNLKSEYNSVATEYEVAMKEFKEVVQDLEDLKNYSTVLEQKMAEVQKEIDEEKQLEILIDDTGNVDLQYDGQTVIKMTEQEAVDLANDILMALINRVTGNDFKNLDDLVRSSIFTKDE